MQENTPTISEHHVLTAQTYALFPEKARRGTSIQILVPLFTLAIL
jgi:hypothetical protein